MTREDAAEILDPETSQNALLKYKEGEQRLEACNEACRIAASTLRAQKTTLDRSRWWCVHCNDIAAKQSMIMHGENYCCNCGRPLTEAAWAELERRINNGTTN